MEPAMTSALAAPAEALPLLLPRPVWETLSAEQQSTYATAQAVLDILPDEKVVTLSSLVQRTRRKADAVLEAVGLLDALDLVNVGRSPRDIMVRVLARPEGHVKIQGPDGEPHWVFVARPVTEPELPKHLLN